MFARIVKYADRIKKALNDPTRELVLLIQDYNPQLLKGGNMYSNWLKICLKYAESEKVPLADWIERKPTFTFSNNI